MNRIKLETMALIARRLYGLRTVVDTKYRLVYIEQLDARRYQLGTWEVKTWFEFACVIVEL